MTAPPLVVFTINDHEFIDHNNGYRLYGKFILIIAFFDTNHVHGSNRIFHCCIHIAFTKPHDIKFCVQVSVRSIHI
ncbi:MAG: hypothetical protein WCG25_06940 [bacterium]